MCDIYVTPYLTEAQMTSGTLAFDLYMGPTIVDRFFRSTLPPSRTRRSFESVFILSLPMGQIECVALVHFRGLLSRISRSAWSQS
jgi:hypothetical protein